jgi:hypothetical protein
MGRADLPADATAMIELMRHSKERKSEVEGMTAPADVRVFCIAQTQCPVRVAQYPGYQKASWLVPA